MGRHPLAGLAAAFSGVSGGFSANVMVGPTDSLLAGLTTEGAKLVNPDYVVGISSELVVLNRINSFNYSVRNNHY